MGKYWRPSAGSRASGAEHPDYIRRADVMIGEPLWTMDYVPRSTGPRVYRHPKMVGAAVAQGWSHRGH